MPLTFPYRLDSQGRPAVQEAGRDAHLRGLIELVLFTRPGERINRSTFGCGLDQLVFSPLDDALATAAKAVIQGSLQQWLGELLTVESVQVEADQDVLQVIVRYVGRGTGEVQSATFSRPLL